MTPKKTSKKGRGDGQILNKGDNSPFAAYATEREDLKSLVYVSPEIENISRYPSQKWINNPEFRLIVIHPDDRSRVASQFQKCEDTGEDVDIQYRWVGPDGEDIPVHDKATRVKDQTGTSQFWQGRIYLLKGQSFWGPITGAKDQDALAASLEQYRVLFDNAPVGIGVSSMAGKLLVFNDAMLVPGGYTREDIARLGNIQELYFDPSQGERVLQMLRDGEAVYKHKIQFRRKDGFPYDTLLTLVPIEYNGEPCVQALVEDVTEQMRAEEVLRASEERLRVIIENTVSVFYTHNTAHVLTYISPQVRDVLDCEPEEALINWHSFLTDNPINQEGIELTQQAIDTGERQKPYVLELVGAKGRRVWVEVYESPVVQDGETVSIVGSLVDITESKETQEALNRRDAILESVAFSAEEFSTAKKWTDRIETVLAQIGKAAGVSRVSIFQNSTMPDGDLVHSKLFEWVVDGVTAEIDNPILQNISYEHQGLSRWKEILTKDQIVVGQVSEFPVSEQEITQPQGISSMVLVPIFAGPKWWGYMSVDECLGEREWHPVEIQALQTEAKILGTSIYREQSEEIIQESEISYQGLFDTVSEAIYIQNKDGYFVDVNQGAVKMYGYPREFLIGKSPLDVSAPGKNDMEAVKHQLDRAFAGEFQTFEFWGMRKNGEIFPKEVRLYKGKYFGQEVVFALAQDITGRKKAEVNLTRQLKELSVLHSVATVAAQAKDEDDLIEKVTAIIGDEFYSDHCGFGLYDPSLKVLRPHPSYRGITTETHPRIYQLDEGIAGRVASTNKAERISDVTKDPAYLEVNPDMRSELCVPIHVGDRLLGIINTESAQVDFYTEADENLLLTVADLVATALEKIHLFEAEQNRRQEAETLGRAAAVVSSSLNVEDVLQAILISLKKAIPYDSASLFLMEEDSLCLKVGEGLPNMESLLNRSFPADNPLFQEIQSVQAPVVLQDAQLDPRFQRWGDTTYIHGWIGVPLMVRNIIFGYITVDSREVGVYNEETATLAQTFAHQASMAIVNAKLYEQAVHTAERLSILHRASHEIASARQDPEQVYEAVHRATEQLMPAEAFAITILDETTRDIIAVYLHDKGEQWPTKRFPYGAGLSSTVVETGQSILIKDLLVDGVGDSIHFGAEEEVRSILAVPLRSSDRVIGMLSAQSYKQDAYTKEDQTLLEMLAANAGVAIENTHLYDETSRRLRELEAINRLSTALRAAQDQNEILRALMNEALKVMDVKAGVIWLYNQETGFLEEAVPKGWFTKVREEPVKRGEGIAGKVFETGDIIISSDFANDPRTRSEIRPHIPPGWGGACIPIRAEQVILGVLFVSVQSPRQVRQDEVSLLVILCEIAGSAIRRAILSQQTERQMQRLASLHAVDMAISSILDLNVTLNIVLDHIIAQLGVDAVDILMLNQHSQTLDYRAGTGFYTDAIMHSHLYMTSDLPGHAIRRRGLVAIPYLATAEEFTRRQILAGERFVSYVGIPLIIKGQVRGVLEIFHRSHLETDSEWKNFLETLAGQVAIAIENFNLLEELQRSNMELSLAYDATIEGWSKALDLRDRETEGHTQRVTEVTLRLARAMGVEDTDLVHMRRGSLLHDIGKMGVPDRILNKTGPLEPEEWNLMKKHPEFAYEMLYPISYLRPALDIPYCHHEYWDGSGYPRGLKGLQIPMAARIFTVVDVWDALSSDRPYRKAWSRETILAYVKERREKQFDPQITDAFLSIESGQDGG